MKTVKITSDHFVNGQTHYPKGSEITVADPIARYIEREGNGVIHKDTEDTHTPPKKKTGKKKTIARTARKKAYSRRDMQAEK